MLGAEPAQVSVNSLQLPQYLLAAAEKNKTDKNSNSRKHENLKQEPSALHVDITLTSDHSTFHGRFLVDTGAPGVYLSGKVSRDLYGRDFPPPGIERSLCTVANSQDVEVLVGPKSCLTVQERSLYLRPLILEDLSFDGILGYNALRALGFGVDVVNHRLLPGTDAPLNTSMPDAQSGVSLSAIQTTDLGILSADSTVTIPARSGLLVPALFKEDSKVNEFVLIEQSMQGTLPAGLIIMTSLASVINSRTTVFILNASPSDVQLHRHARIASATRVDHRPIMHLNAMEQSEESTDRKDFLSQFPDSSTLDPLQRKRLHDLLWAERRIFSKHDFDVGKIPHIEHHIDTGNERPYRETLRRSSPKTREDLKTLVDEMLAQGIIQESFSPWSSAPVLVRKKSGGLRFAVDYRGLNAKTVKDSFPLPQIADALDCFAGAKWFSCVDLTQGYWNIAMDAESRPKTAFHVPQGLYEFLRMPYGLVSAPATFQRAMQSCLAGLNWQIALCFLDDIIVFSSSFDQHLERLKIIFDRLAKFNLKLKPKKCQFMKKEVAYLGHIVSEKGISTDPAKIEAIQKWQRPTTPTHVRSFLGLSQYYRRFVKDFSSIAAPLHEAIVHNSKKIIWGDEQEEAFIELKKALSQPPIMSHPDFSKDFIIDTDASDVGVGAVLSQLHDGREHVIAYQSHKFDKAQRKWSTTDREFFGMVLACRLFKSYIYGRRFILRTDHQALLGILRAPKDMSPKWSRWWSEMNGHDCKVIYRPGKIHGNADGLSRTTQFDDLCIDFSSNSPGKSVNAIVPTPAEPAMIKDIQTGDPIVSQIVKCIKMQIPTKNLNDVLDSEDPYHDAFIKRSKRFSLKNGVLQYDNLPVVPRPALPSLMSSLHDAPISGHLGRNKTSRVIKERFWWPSWSDDVRRYVQSCLPCQERKGQANKRYAPLHPSTPCDRPWERIAVDLVSLPPSHGCTYVLVVVDYFSKWVEAFPLRNKEASTVANILLNNVFYHHGPPEFLHSDRGSEFTAKCLHELTRMCGIYQTHTPAYRPRADGLVERQIGTIRNMLAKFHAQYGDWYQYLGPALFALRTAVQETTKYSPYEVLYGRRPRIPCDLNYGLPSSSEQAHPTSYRAMRQRLHQIYENVRRELATAADRMKQRYDASHRVGPSRLKRGDWVWIQTPPGHKNKMQSLWDGPYLVTSTNLVGSLEVRRRGTFSKVPWDHCKLFHQRPEHLQSPEYIDALRTATVDFQQVPPALRLGVPRNIEPRGRVSQPVPGPSSSTSLRVGETSFSAAIPKPGLRSSMPAASREAGSGQRGTQAEVQPLVKPTQPRPPSPSVLDEPPTVNTPQSSSEPSAAVPAVPSAPSEPVVLLERLPEEVVTREVVQTSTPAPEVAVDRSKAPTEPPVRTEANPSNPDPSRQCSAPPRRQSSRVREAPQRLGYDKNFQQINAIISKSCDFWLCSPHPVQDLGFKIRDMKRPDGTHRPCITGILPGSIAAHRQLHHVGAAITHVGSTKISNAQEFFTQLDHASNSQIRIGLAYL